MVAGSELSSYSVELFGTFLAALTHLGSPLKRRAALCGLDALLSHAGPDALPVAPYVEFPSLLPTLLHSFHASLAAVHAAPAVNRDSSRATVRYCVDDARLKWVG